jgi:hypothetical protein
LTLSDLQYLVHQLGPATPEITTIVQEAIDSWMVEFDEGVSMQLAWDARSGRVRMQCAVGQPEEAAREAIYATLLNANLLLTGVADIKLALGSADEDVMLIGEYAIEEAAVESLRYRLSEFLDFAAKFSQMMADTFEQAAPPAGQATSFMLHDQV